MKQAARIDERALAARVHREDHGEGVSAPGAPAPVAPGPRVDPPLHLGGMSFTVLPEGGLWHDELRMLIVADLHFEKGSAYAARGRGMLPPYDTAATLALLSKLMARTNPKCVVALGDSFHDSRAGERIYGADVDTLCGLQKERDWIWVAGNHDPKPPSCVSGDWREEFRFGDVVLRHEPTPGEAPGEIAGHLHPVAKIQVRGTSVRRRCVATDGSRAVLPAFGVYAGGLNVCDRAFGKLFKPGTLCAWMLGQSGVYRMPESHLLPDGGG